jgi:uncharacterized membrane protein
VPSIANKLFRRIRRPRLLTALVLSIGLFGFLQRLMPVPRALLLSFDIGVALFLGLMIFLMSRATTHTMCDRAKYQDNGKWTVLVFSLLVATVVVGSLSSELHAAKDKSWTDFVLASGTLLLSWLFVALTFSQQYAHSFYTTQGRLQFPGTEHPDYWDFLYFSVVLSMCCQTSDVVVTSSDLRRLVLLQSVVSFFFNVIIISISVNVIAGFL